MKRTTGLILAGLAAALCGCGPDRPASDEASPKAEAPAQSGYVAPPAVTGAEAAGREVVLTGRAQPGARVRLATPQGEARTVEADAKGAWRLALPASDAPRIFGLSMAAGGRTVQAEGYLLVTAQGRPVQLRAGAGALTLGPAAPPRITAFDFDADGGAVVSGAAPADATVSVRIDGRQMGEGRADDAGRYAIALSQPLPAGPHQVETATSGAVQSASVEVSAAAPLTEGPFRASAAPQGLRVDWMTPGGGVQSTVVLD